jgi:DNA-binding NarL/FixJ family response regulator
MTQDTGDGAAVCAQRVVVVDDHRTFTDLLVIALDGLEDIECVGQAHDAATTRELVRSVAPDTVIMDVELARDDGIDLSAELLAADPDLRVIVLTAHSSRGMIQRAAEAGVCAVLPKDGALPSVLHALRTARRDSFVVDPSLLHSLISAPDERPAQTPLSEREQEVLSLIAEGMDARRAAKSLDISIHTFRGHVRSVLTKLDAHSQLEAVAIAKRNGYLK